MMNLNLAVLPQPYTLMPLSKDLFHGDPVAPDYSSSSWASLRLKLHMPKLGAEHCERAHHGYKQNNHSNGNKND